MPLDGSAGSTGAELGRGRVRPWSDAGSSAPKGPQAPSRAPHTSDQEPPDSPSAWLSAGSWGRRPRLPAALTRMPAPSAHREGLADIQKQGDVKKPSRSEKRSWLTGGRTPSSAHRATSVQLQAGSARHTGSPAAESSWQVPGRRRAEGGPEPPRPLGSSSPSPSPARRHPAPDRDPAQGPRSTRGQRGGAGAARSPLPFRSRHPHHCTHEQRRWARSGSWARVSGTRPRGGGGMTTFRASGVHPSPRSPRPCL